MHLTPVLTARPMVSKSRYVCVNYYYYGFKSLGMLGFGLGPGRAELG